MTNKASFQSSRVDDIERFAIDTEGFEDGVNNTTDQIANLARFMRNWKKGVNALVIVLNWMNPRFNQKVKDTVKFAFNAFKTAEIVKHIAVVFTHCYEKLPGIPDRQKLKKEYGEEVNTYLASVAKTDKPNVPVYFVDSQSWSLVRTFTSPAEGMNFSSALSTSVLPLFAI